MEDKFKKIFCSKYYSWLALLALLALIFILPKFLSAVESVNLNTPSASCLVSTLQITLTWTSSITGSPVYDVWRKEGTGSYIKITPTPLPTGTTQYIDNTALSGKTYTYQIRAERGSDMFYSEERVFVPTSNDYCQAVLSATAPSCQQADGPHLALTWAAASGDLLPYQIYRDGENLGETSGTNFDDNQTKGLEGTKNYNTPGYVIKTRWQDGTAKDSSPVPATALACPPNLTATPGCSDGVAPGGPKVELSWNDLLGVSEYQIYRKAQSETDFSWFKTVSQASYTDYLVQSLPTTYHQGGQVSYYAKAKWPNGEQKDSEIKLLSIQTCKPFLTVETICSITEGNYMRLTWTATKDTTNYNIYRDGSFTGKQLGPVELTTNEPAESGSTHSFYVDAIGAQNYQSNQVEKTIDCSPKQPSPPPHLNQASTYCISGVSAVSFTWSPSNDVSYYEVIQNYDLINTTKTTGTYFGNIESGIAIQGGYTYTYIVRAWGIGGLDQYSDNEQTIIAPNCTQPSASTLTISPPACENGEPVINLSWTQTTNTEGYEIWRGPSSTDFNTLVTTVDESITTFKDINVSRSTTYYYKIVSKGPTGVASTNSNIPPSVTTGSCYPNTPTLSFTPAPSCESGTGNAIVNLSWAAGGSNTHHYEIYRQDYSETTPIKSEYNISVTTWQDKPLSSQTSYNYKIVAVGYGDPLPRISDPASGYKSVTTPNCATPGAFTLNEPAPYCQGPYPRADLSWTPASNATSYDVLRNAISIVNTTATSFSDRGLGNALSFNGSNQYVDAGNSSSLNITGNLTIEAWIYLGSFGGNSFGRIVDKLQTSSAGFAFYVVNSAGENSLRLYFNASAYASASNNSIFLNTWQHVAVSFNGANATFYVNGVPKGSPALTTNPASGVQKLTIGNRLDLTRGFDGIIDEVRIYNQALSPAEIQQHYNGIYNDDNDTRRVGIWHFDEGSGLTASDSSNSNNNGYANNGTLVGPTWLQNGLQWQNNYSWQARANSPGGTSYSNTTNNYTIPVCQPTKPGLVLSSFCQAGNKAAVILRWSYTTNTNQYEIYRDGVQIATVSGTTHEWTDNNGGAGLIQGANYTYHIKAIGTAGTSQSDNIPITTVTCAAPTQPFLIDPGFECNGSLPRVRISWQDAQNTTSYTVFRDMATQIGLPVPDNDSPTYTVIDTGVQVNTTYLYHVTANGPGGSTVSIQKQITTSYCPPSTPSISSLTTGCSGTTPYIDIAWTDATPFNTFEYKIYRNTSATLPASPSITVASTTLPNFSSRTWHDLGLPGLTDHFYWVKAWGPKGEKISAVSGPKKTFSCQPPPAPTLGLTNRCTSGNNPITLLSWNKTTETTSYQLYKNGASFKTLTPSSGAYLRDWLLIGPFAYTFDNTGNTGSTYNAFHYDFLKGETTIKPRAGEVTEGKTWTQYNSSGDLINFNSIFSPNEYVIAYAFAYLYSPNNQSAKLKIGSDDGIKVFLNGQKVADYYVWRGAAPDQNTIDINLQPGINILLVKVQEGSGSWGFYARITDASGNDILNNMTYWDSTAATGVGANYTVTATGTGGTSPNSNPVSSTPLNCLPATPQLTVQAICPNGIPMINLSWQPDENTNYWSIFKRRESEGFAWLSNIPSPTTSYPDSNIESGINFQYRITAYGGNGTPSDDVYSELVQAPFCGEAPPPPVITDVLPACYGQNSWIKIVWEEDLSGKTLSYNIWRRNVTLGEEEPDFLPVFSGLPANETEFVDSYNIVEKKDYKYKIEAVGSAGTTLSEPSEMKTSKECTNIPPFPTDLRNDPPFSTGDLIYVTLRWSDAGPETSYRLFRRELGTTNWIQISPLDGLPAYDGAGDAPPYTDFTIEDNKTYEYRVYAYNDFAPFNPSYDSANPEGTTGGIYSNKIEVYVPIARPGNFTLSGQRVGNDIQLSWTHARTTSAGGPITYTLFRDDTDAFNTTQVPGCQFTCSDTNFPCGGLADPIQCTDVNPPSTERFYRVEARNNASQPTYSNTFRIGIATPNWKEIFPW